MVADRFYVWKTNFSKFRHKKSTILLLFSSDIKEWKTQRPANSLSCLLSLSPEHFSSLLNRYEWLLTNIMSKKTNFSAFWRKKSKILSYLGLISTHKKRSALQTLYLALSLSSQNNFLHFQNCFEWSPTDFMSERRILVNFDTKNQQFCCYSVQISKNEKRSAQQTLYLAFSLSPQNIFLHFWTVMSGCWQT